MTADPMRTGRSIRLAKPGARALTSIPIATGTSTIANTLRTSPSGSDTSSPRS